MLLLLSEPCAGKCVSTPELRSTPRPTAMHLVMTCMPAQVKYILGYNIPHVDRIQDLVYNLVANAHKFQWREFVMGVSWILLLLLIKNAPRYNK